jgi:hypothetical protein
VWWNCEIFLSLEEKVLLRGTAGGQIGRKTANMEVKKQKSANMSTILNA